MNYNSIKFVIVGGGTAGWITAISLRKHFPKNSIKLIESSEIGILGAGEGTTPSFVDFLREVDIDLGDFLSKTKATIKNGIKFTNWHGDNSYYFHPFAEGEKYNVSIDPSHFSNILFTKIITQNRNTHELSLSHFCSEVNKVRFYNFKNDTQSLEHEGTYALHFDARLVAEYLKNVAINRNVERIDAKVVSINQNSLTKNINSVSLENGDQIECDFVFDCTGFSRMIIGNLFKEKWIDHRESLPVDRALPFFIQNDTECIPPYTESIAMKYGWIWKIPVQGRYGCGYVFDSSYVSDDEIKKEVCELFGDVDFPRSFSFKAGFYENSWVKNCIALGLSSGFIEPLEATSIWVTLRSLDNLLKKYKSSLLSDNEKNKQLYNRDVYEMNDQIKDFIQLHYLTERNDSEFWTNYRNKNKIVDRILEYENVETVEEYLSLSLKKFSDFHPYHVFVGVKFYKTELFKKHLEISSQYPENLDYKENLNKLNLYLNNFRNKIAIDHFDFLNNVVQKNNQK